MTNDSAPKRSWPIYVVTGIAAMLGLIFGSFFVVWCGTLRFLFSSDSSLGSFGLLIFPGLIAFQALRAARAAWIALPSGPGATLGALLITEIFVVFIEVYAWSSEGLSWLSPWVLTPHVVLIGLMGVIYWLSPHFTGHLIEVDTDFVAEAPYTVESDDDEWMHLGGA